MRYLLVGFVDQMTYEARHNGWEPDEEFGDIGAAITASRQWLAEHQDGVVEVIRFGGRASDVVALVTEAAVEHIDPPPASAKKQSRLDRWMETPIGATIAGLVFVSVGVVMVVFAEQLTRRNESPGLIRLAGVVTVGFFGAALVIRFVRWLRDISDPG